MKGRFVGKASAVFKVSHGLAVSAESDDLNCVGGERRRGGGGGGGGQAAVLAACVAKTRSNESGLKKNHSRAVAAA